MSNVLERSSRYGWLAFAGLAAITVLIYANGLHGPFLLDDGNNLDTINRWLQGRLDWRSAIDNRAGPGGRVLPMLTFLFDAWRSHSMDAFAFKTTNLVIHLLSGGAVFALARQIFRRVDASSPRATTWALFVAALWLWMPLQVSTVLYVVQRMAQLAALFSLLALCVFMAARSRLEAGRSPGALAALWLGVPTLTLLGLLSKENAILVPLLAAVLEFTLFHPSPASNRPLPVKLFFMSLVAVPVTAATAYLVLHPSYLAGGYAVRSFTLSERMLTEPRILWDYVRTLLLPVGPDMSLFHDDYRVSTGLFAPPSTLAALLAWIAVLGVAVLGRRRYPLVSLGIGFFLVGHLLESTIIPLELYFEHRNYLPAFGLPIALVGAGLAMRERLPAATAGFRRASASLVVALPLIYAAGTWVQAGSWSDQATLFAMQETYRPTSPRLQSVLAARAIEAHDTPRALEHIDMAERYGPPSEAMTATIWRMIAYCEGGTTPPATLYSQMVEREGLGITTYGMVYWEKLAALADRCPGLDTTRLVAIGKAWLANDRSPPGQPSVWRTRYNLGRVEAVSGHLDEAEAAVRQAWIDSGYNVGIGVYLFQLNATLGRRDACTQILARLRKDADMGNKDLRDAIELFQQAMDQGRIGRGTP
ncbi:hypothetical protein P3W24_02925 [Luteibacter sp. PPL201]|uniref:Tetratricopeptide repeat protein n=1 Tax=Luteibacter sahnii TaxID=3021977 RepID=A0ABT6B757_9GAMM